MTKFHHVQALEFEGDDLILKVDNQVARTLLVKFRHD